MIGELSMEAARVLLARLHIGHLGVLGGGRVYIFPVSYGYDGEYIYVESHEGLKVHLMRAHPEVCLEVEEIDGPSRWRTVIVHGLFEELREEQDRDRAFAIIAAQGEARSPDSIAPYVDGPARIVVYRIRIVDMSGHFEQGASLVHERTLHPTA